ncbi:MAG: HAD family hydrolase [Coriobacteriales bacterium]
MFDGLASSSGLATQAAERKDAQGKTTLAVFDIDGTVIDGQSPAIIAFNLFKAGVLPSGRALLAGVWGLKYKAGLTIETEAVRRRVFSSFRNMSSADANKIIEKIYKTKIYPKLRPEALEKIRWHKERGDVPIFVTATFEPIAKMMAEDSGVERQVSTKMVIENDRYTGEIDGKPVEGDEKVVRLKLYADKNFGRGNWEIGYSYADHFTDLPILSIAKHPVAVNPKTKLRTAAERNGWEIQEW